MKAKITVSLKPGILDPQAKTAHESLHSLGWKDVVSLSHQKQFIIECDAQNSETFYQNVDDMCQKLLVNTVMENYTIEIIEPLL